ncbi:thiamine pyrophosphate-binding protein [Cupriavidus sp. 2TAF22]|uniref:thiamine pyrophosphate-binding protein n=1 Tax=unclassified Cupriavidus TaxID=2640874 RepID=UPI003F921AD1
MAKSHRGADALAGTLAQAGVKRIFTLSGNHIMPVFDACLDAGVGLLHTRHEAATVHMADAWARLTGEFGVAMVTGGPGHANAVSALYTAQMSESPLVLLSGHAPNRQHGFGAFQEMRQAEMAAPVAKAAWTCAGADSIAADMALAMQIAASGRPGPVHLSLPTDALEDAVREAGVPASIAVPAHAPALAAQDASAVLSALAGARRPLILAGPAWLTARARVRTAELEARTGIPVVGMESPRGNNDPSLGAFAQMLAQADCVLLLGKRLDFTLRFGGAPAFAADCSFLQIDADESELARSRRAAGDRLRFARRADVGSAIAQLVAGASGPQRHRAWLDEVAAAIRYRPDAWNTATAAGALHPVQVCRPLQAILDSHPDAVLVSDGGEFGQWAQACLHAPHRVINGPAGAIGAGLPMALAARLAQPDAPVIAMMGDGTTGFHVAEFDTAVRYGLPFVAVVGNDARWNAEYQIQLNSYGKERLVGCELLPTRYDQVCAAFGGHGELVQAPDQLLPAVRRAIASGRPACVNVRMEGVAAPVVARR